MEKQNKTRPTILVIFGISGDLAQRYLLPALAAINKNNQLPQHFCLLGITRQKLTLSQVLQPQCRDLGKFSQVLTMNLGEAAEYNRLAEKISHISRQYRQPAQVIFYFAVPPAAVLPIVRHLGEAELNKPDNKLLLEKPFGVDLESAKELIAQTQKYFSEEQVYRIDHYLAKAMSQNIAVFLGGNALFRDVWNSNFIDKIEVIAAEKIDIEGRAGFYEQSGALRDLIQSHLLQLSALVLMKPCPDVFDFSQLSRRRWDALKQLQLATPDAAKAAVRAQYDGYKKEVNNPRSTTETFVQLHLKSSDPRWQGTDIELITGKALAKKSTEIRVYFKKQQAAEANKLTLRIQPHEGIELELWVKKPGYEQDLAKLPLDFNYDQYFGANLPDAYEQVIIDAVRGSQNLFASSREVLETWRILKPVQQHWSMTDSGLKTYAKGATLESTAI